MKTFLLTFLLAALAALLLAAVAGCAEQASYVDRIDRAKIRQYCTEAVEADLFLHEVKPLANTSAVIITRAEWAAILDCSAVNVAHWRDVDLWAKRFAPPQEQPSQGAVDPAKSVVPEDRNGGAK